MISSEFLVCMERKHIYANTKIFAYMYIPLQNQNYLLQGRLLVVQASPTECSRNPSVSVCQLVLLWEAEFSFSKIFLEDSFNVFPHLMMGDLRVHLPTSHWVFSSFWPKNRLTWVPHPLYSPILPWATIFVSWNEKSPQRETFCQCERGETKNDRSTKHIKIDEFKNCFEQWKKCLDRCIASNGEYFEGDYSLNM